MSVEPEPGVDPRASGALRHTVARGTIINAAFTVGLDTLNLLKGVTVAALLSASEFGVWGILVIALGTLGLLKEGIVGDKFVQQDEQDQEAAFQQALTIEALLNLALTVVVLAALPLFALAYGEDEIVLPGLVLVVAIPFATLQSPLWIFYRRMRFLEQRKLQAADPLASFVVTVALAAGGLGYWSLVIGVVAGRAAGALVAVRASPYRLGWRLERATVREYVSFSGPLFVASASRVIGVQALIFAGEAELGLAGVGIITLASSIRLYADKVDSIITQTIYPAVCAVRDRRDLLFEAFVKSNRLGLVWGMPFGIALALFAEDLVAYVLGSEWEPGIGLLQAFGLLAAINHIGYNWTAFFRARGETRPIAVMGVVGVVSMVGIAVPLLLSDGLQGLALGIGLSGLVALAGRSWYLAKLFPGFQVLAHSARAIAPTVPPALAVLGLRALTDIERSAGLALAEIALFSVLTIAFTALLERALLREVRAYLRPVAAG